jgi:ATP-dependent Lon protease
MTEVIEPTAGDGQAVMIPAANARDVKPLPEAVTRGLTLHYVSRFEEVAKLAFPSRF